MDTDQHEEASAEPAAVKLTTNPATILRTRVLGSSVMKTSSRGSRDQPVVTYGDSKIRAKLSWQVQVPRTESLQRPMEAASTSSFPSEHSHQLHGTPLLTESNDGAEAVAPLANRHHWIAVPCLRTRAPRGASALDPQLLGGVGRGIARRRLR